ncbi:MAG: LamG-like jellyroll fold domain-containing protein, partial [Planctomycetia bacterium]|nr:LamG-like jellyroll fold domain-containing protein [Planctomycetia bacterium]
GAIDLRNDLAARFDFGKRGTDQFPNFAASKRYKNCAVQTAGIEYEEGAIPDSSAIRLKSKNGEIRSNLFGSESNLTIVLQVRIDRLRPMSNILFTAGENHNAPGTVLFQLIGSGDLNLRVRGKEENQYFHAASVISSSQFGVWTKLGVVFDEKNRAISFWKDGQLLKKLEWNDPVPISLANLSFMNGMIDRKSDRTHLYGAIQNVLIFNSALGAEDLESITK